MENLIGTIFERKHCICGSQLTLEMVSYIQKNREILNQMGVCEIIAQILNQNICICGSYLNETMMQVILRL